MGNKIIHKKSIISGNMPPLSSLSAGEIAINAADGYIFFKKNSEEGEHLSKFVDQQGHTHVLNESLSSFVPQYGGNTTSEVFASVLGGFQNNVSGAASSVVNGENNDITSDFSFIGSGLNNKINGDYSFNAAGQNNLIQHENCFTLGSNLSSHANNFTYVNNISANGKFYGDGSKLTGIIAQGVIGPDTVVRSLTSNWENTYTTVKSNSSNWLQDLQSILSQGNNSNLSLTASDIKATGFLYGDGSEINGNLSVFGTTSLSGNTVIGDVGSANTTFFVDSNKVGINTENPSKELTVIGDVSASGKYYGDGSQLTGIISGDTEATTFVRSNSSNWDSTYTNVKTNSATWAYSEYVPLSGGLINGSLTAINITSTGKFYGDGSSLTGIVAGDTQATSLVRSNSAQWQSTYSYVNSTSANFVLNNDSRLSDSRNPNSHKTTHAIGGSDVLTPSDIGAVSNTYFGSVSGNWDSTYNTVQSNSATNWNYQGSDLKALSGNWQNTYSNFSTQSENNISVYTTVNSNSSTNWNYQGSDIKSLSGNWQSTYSTVTAMSANWQTTFQASSSYISSNATGITGATSFTNIIQITQAGYNALSSPSSNTLYIII